MQSSRYATYMYVHVMVFLDGVHSDIALPSLHLGGVGGWDGWGRLFAVHRPMQLLLQNTICYVIRYTTHSYLLLLYLSLVLDSTRLYVVSMMNIIILPRQSDYFCNMI